MTPCRLLNVARSLISGRPWRSETMPEFRGQASRRQLCRLPHIWEGVRWQRPHLPHCTAGKHRPGGTEWVLYNEDVADQEVEGFGL